MLKNEARWLGEWLAKQPPSRFPLFNLGSSTQDFRTNVQPWIDRELFAPLRKAGRPVVHVDRKLEQGVDLVGDVTDPSFIGQLRSHQPRTILCSNLLEHVVDLGATCRLLASLVPPAGQLVITGPYRYPLHLDPIDNGFRGSPEQVAELFPGSRMAARAIIEDGTFVRYLFRSPRIFVDELVRVVTPFLQPRRWVAGMRRWGWLHRRYAATAVVLRWD